MTGRKVLTAGVFDLLHFGHFELFRRAKELAGNDGTLTVGVKDDAAVARDKPQARLFYSWETRAGMIRALRFVDCVIPYDVVDRLVAEVEFDILVVGGDQTHPGIQRAVAWCEEHGKDVVRLSRTAGVSSSLLRQGVMSDFV